MNENKELENFNHISSSITLKHLLSVYKKTNSLWSSQANKSGITEEEVNNITRYVTGEIKKHILDTNNSLIQLIIKHYNVYETNIDSCKRTDYLGRAIIQDRFSQCLPNTDEEIEELQQEPVKGKLPRETIDGIIDIVKCVENIETLNDYSHACFTIREEIKSKYGQGSWDKFYSNEKVKRIVKNLYDKFTNWFNDLDKDRRKDFIIKRISSSQSVKEMERDLVDSEFETIIKKLSS